MSDRNRDLDDEIKAHLEMATRDRVERGASPSDAAAGARREFGNVAIVKEVTREMWGTLWIERIIQDVRYALRLLGRSPGFTTVAVVSLALGIGANTALFQVINAVRLRPLPVQDAGALAQIHIADTAGARGNFDSRYTPVTNPIWERFAADQQAFSGVFAWYGTTFNLTPGGVARRARGIYVSGRFFDVLGIRPADGRLLSAGDDVRGCPLRAVVSHSFWKRELAGRPLADQQTLRLDGHPTEIVGISERGFYGVEVGRGYDVAVPICAEPLISGSTGRLTSATDWWLTIMGRLKPGWSLDDASAHLATISPGIFNATLPPTYPVANVDHYRNFSLRATSGARGASALREDYETPLWLLLSIAALVLVIACVNLTNLMLARASVREREFAVRLGLGASRGRILRQLLVESLLLSLIGSAAGGLLAGFLSRALVASFEQGSDAVVLELTPDWRVLTFAASAAVFTCLLFGLAPALRATRTGSGSLLGSAGRGLTGSRERLYARRALVSIQVALSVLLLVGALLFTRTLTNLERVNPGFQAGGVLLAEMDFRAVNLAVEARHGFHTDVLSRLTAVPGVHAVAEASVIPLSGDSWSNNVWVGDPGRPVAALLNRVTEGYWQTLGIPLVSGRNFTGADTASAPPVAIVNRALLRTLGVTNPLGERLKIEPVPGRPEVTSFEIVGVVEDSKYEDIREEPPPLVFLPTLQARAGGRFARVMVRSELPPASIIPTLTRVLGELNPAIVVTFTPLTTQIRDKLLRERLMASLSASFGIIAAVLAVVGLYGVIAYTVARRTKEIGVRMALGASRRDVGRTIMAEALVLVVAGIAGGAALAFLGGEAARSMLFGVEPNDPATVAMAAGALAAVALLASYLPARAAARIEPIVALRNE